MEIESIIRLLTNSGFKVLGTDSAQQYLYLEDPSCIIRSFETFIEYAWIFIYLITAILLFGWGISKIRGANTDVATNIRNLVIIFGTLGIAGPIVNAIYGGDLIGRGCAQIQVSLADVQKTLNARNEHLSPDESLFEGIDIYDSGVDFGDMSLDDIESVEVPEIEYINNEETGEIEPIYNEHPETQPEPILDRNPEDVLPENDTEQIPVPDIVPPVSAPNKNLTATSGPNNSVIYIYPNGTRYQHSGGTRAWRNTNPGNIRGGYGAIGSAGGFAVYASESDGMQAIKTLLRSPSYNNLTIINAIKRYAPAADRNDPVRYANTISRQTGLNVNRTISSLSDTELQSVANVIRRVEGWRVGTRTML